MPARNTSKQDALLLLAAAPGGTSNSEAAAAMKTQPNHCSTALCRMAKIGLVIRVHVTGHDIRWFRTDAAAAKWARETKPKWSAAPHRQWVQSPKPAPKAQRLPPRDGQVIIPKGVKRTVALAPTYDARFQVDPKSRPYGAGFSAVGVGRNVETGGAWE